MRICLYTHVFLPNMGGIQTSTVQFAEGLQARGHQVTVVTEEPAPDGFDARFPFKVLRAPEPDWREILPEADVILSNGFSVKHLREWRKSRVPFGWIHQMLIGRKTFAVRDRQLRWWLRYHMRKFAIRLGHFNVCVSEFMREHIGTPSATVIYNPVSPAFRKPDAPLPPANVAYFGRMWNAKGIMTLVEAVRLLRDRGLEVPVDFFGEGQDKDQTVAMAKELRVDDLCTFRAFLTGAAMIEATQRAKFIVVPTIIEEPFGLAGAEPMACGKAVIASRGGGLGEIVKGAGLLFDGGNAGQLAACIEELWKHPDRVAECERLALTRAKLFSRDVICEQYEAVLTAAVAKYGRKRAESSRAAPAQPPAKQSVS